MGIFDFLKKDKIENENKTKPFHMNVNAAERKDWFSRTRPWHNVDACVLDALIGKFGEDPMFEVFVVTSMEQGLVPQYAHLRDRGLADSPGIICSVISGILFKSGAAASSILSAMFSSGKLSEKVFKKQYAIVLNSLETAIILEEKQIGAYVQLAGVKMLLNKREEALSYADQGLMAIQSIRVLDAPFHMSTIEAIQNAPQHLDDTEQLLIAMKRDLRS